MRVRTAAKRSRISKGAWVRQAIEEKLHRPAAKGDTGQDALERLANLEAPTCDIDQMLAEIETGRL